MQPFLSCFGVAVGTAKSRLLKPIVTDCDRTTNKFENKIFKLISFLIKNDLNIDKNPQ